MIRSMMVAALLLWAAPTEAQPVTAMASPSMVGWPSLITLMQDADSARYAISWGQANNTVYYELRLDGESHSMEDAWTVVREVTHPRTADTVTVALFHGGGEMRVCVRGVNTRDGENFRFGPQRCVIEPLPDLLEEPGDPGTPNVTPIPGPGGEGAWIIQGIYADVADSVWLAPRVADPYMESGELRPVVWIEGDPWVCTETRGWPHPPSGVSRGWDLLYVISGTREWEILEPVARTYLDPGVRFDLLSRDHELRFRADPECDVRPG